MTPDAPHTEESPRFVWAVLAIYTAFVSIVSAFHEPWKDETQTWRLAIDSDGLRALAHNARYEGHPLLFHVMLQALGHVSRSWWAAATLHVIIAALGAWLVLRYAPFTRLQKVLLVFGYWMAYEYAVVVRPYGLGLMLAYAACIAWTAQRRRTGWAALLLVLLANTTAMGTLLAMTLAFGFAVDWGWPDEGRPRPSRRALLGGGFAALVATIVVLYAVSVQMKPPADAAYQGQPRAAAGLSKWDLAQIPTTELRALVPVVRVSSGVVQWHRWYLLPESSPALAALLLASLAALALGCIMASRRRVALVVFVAGTTGYLLFFGFVFPGAGHHHGYIFAVWILSAWLAWGEPASRWPPALQRMSEHFERERSRILTLSLVLPVLATVEVAAGDLAGTFADARHVADVIRSHGLADVTVVTAARSEGQAVAAFLDRPVLYPLEGKRRTFVVWGGPSTSRKMMRAVDSTVTQLLTRECEVVVLSSPARDVPRSVAIRSKALYTTPGVPMSDDRYRVWLAKAPPSPRCPTGG
ncbi:MAG: hypothetical protein JF589_01810 [Gemmatimonadetes bacterium]|nr:hypothetical protein [Gemmatimonadota bacterium]